MDTPTAKEAIDAVRKRPRMFLKRDSVHDLCIFLTGYCFGLDVAGPGQFPHGDDLQAFRRWLAERLGKTEQDDLDDLLLAESNNDDAEAFQMFFALWDEFRAKASAS
jgi:hypothetical protein